MTTDRFRHITLRLRPAHMSRAAAVALCTLVCVLTALMGSDWPRVVHPEIDGWPTPQIKEMAQSVVYGCPVPVCLLAAWLLGRIPAQTAVQRRWRLGIIIFAMLVGLLPLWGVNRFWFYRLGTPGFMTPFALSVILFPPAWNMSVPPRHHLPSTQTQGTCQHFPSISTITIIALLWVTAVYLTALYTYLPMWLLILPVPLVAATFLRPSTSRPPRPSVSSSCLPYFSRYLWLMFGCTAVALAMRTIMYLLKYNDVPFH